MKNDFLPDSVCFHYLVRVEKNCWRFHTCVENCMHVQVWTLFHVANQQSSHDQVVATTTTTTKSCDQHHGSLKLFSPHAYKAKLTSSPDDTMMQFKTSGGQYGSEVCWNRLHHCQEEGEMART